MFVLSRNPMQKIIIKDNIKIIYLGLDSRGHARFGIDAPKDVRILREELHIQNKLEDILDERLKNTV